MRLQQLVDEFKQDYTLGIELNAAHAQREIHAMCKAATEFNNRRFGQIMRYTLARIELAKRECRVRK